MNLNILVEEFYILFQVKDLFWFWILIKITRLYSNLERIKFFLWKWFALFFAHNLLHLIWPFYVQVNGIASGQWLNMFTKCDIFLEAKLLLLCFILFFVHYFFCPTLEMFQFLGSREYTLGYLGNSLFTSCLNQIKQFASCVSERVTVQAIEGNFITPDDAESPLCVCMCVGYCLLDSIGTNRYCSNRVVPQSLLPVHLSDYIR